MMRLDKYLAAAGIGSRSEVKQYIKKGRVSVDGNCKVKDDYKIEPGVNKICFDKREAVFNDSLSYFVLNKPAGVITATKDNFQKTVLDLLPNDIASKVSPVGRLDKDTEGLLILTDDGDFNHRMMSPKKHVYKTYFARLSGECDDSLIDEFRAGVDIGDDTLCKSAKLEINEDRKEVFVSISEGRYHQVKRMFLKYGLKVEYLKRVAIGKLCLPSDLLPGEYRELSEEEKTLLFMSAES